MRRLLALCLLTLTAAPLFAQKAPKRDRFKIETQEIAEYGEQNLIEVISKARPHFFQFNAGTSVGMGEATMAGVAPRLLVYVGTQAYGDTSVLRLFKASEMKEIRYYRPNDAMARLGANNAYVIQVLRKAEKEKH